MTKKAKFTYIIDSEAVMDIRDIAKLRDIPLCASYMLIKTLQRSTTRVERADSFSPYTRNNEEIFGQLIVVDHVDYTPPNSNLPSYQLFDQWFTKIKQNNSYYEKNETLNFMGIIYIIDYDAARIKAKIEAIE